MCVLNYSEELNPLAFGRYSFNMLRVKFIKVIQKSGSHFYISNKNEQIDNSQYIYFTKGKTGCLWENTVNGVLVGK